MLSSLRIGHGTLILSLIVTGACSDSTKKLDVGTTCILNSDCNPGLACTMGKCHAICKASADCPLNQTCLKLTTGFVCQLPSEKSCAQTMCNGILTCAIDQVCRTPCQFASECGSGQVCTGNVCAELSDLDVNGQLTRVVPMVDGGVKDAGKDSMPPDTQVENLPDPDTRPRDTATPDTTLSPDTALAPDTSPPDTRIVDLALPDTNPPDTAPPAPDTAPIDGASLVLTGCSAPALSQRYFCDDFEAGLDKWVVSGRDWNTTATVSRSPARCVTDSPEGNYPKGAKNEITLAASVDLTTTISPVLTFWHLLGLHDNDYSTDYYGDLTYVDASTDGGSTWTQLKRFTLTDSTTTWAQVQLSLASVAGKKAKLRFRLVDQVGLYAKDEIDPTQANGWYIDDVEIREAN